MSFIYSVLKPILRIAAAKKQTMTREDFIRQAKKVQKRQYKLPDIKGYEKQEQMIGGYRCIIYAKQGSEHKIAIVYYAGGGYIRYQLPNSKSIQNYIDQTGCDLWIPLYPIYLEHDMNDGVRFGYVLHQKMLERYSPKQIAWLGYSAGAVLVMGLGRHIVHEDYELPMPGVIVAFSVFNLYTSQESLERMNLLKGRDVVMGGELQKQFREFYDPDSTIPKHIAGCAAEDNYTGFPPILLGFGGDEMMSGDAPDYEAAFKRCNVKDYKIHIEPDTFHAYPVFTFTPEGKRGEQQVIRYIRQKLMQSCF
ncbi:MAG: alpha/beta hydrolase fold domain-containing protein [Ruminococcus sp.]|nr:alpha/beta hydrolase fold domain-containing protein [Ruminococcus sp.]